MIKKGKSMGKMLERKCRYCGKEYKYEGVANFIAFCPHCKRYDFSESEYGYGSITPCRIIIGEKTIGEVKGDSKSGYELLVPELEIYEKLNESIFPLTQAADIVDYKMNHELGYMDFRSGEFILLGERLCRGYTFRQFKKSSMYCGQSAERYITLNKAYRINDKGFYVSLLFKHGLLYLISLVCNDISLSPDEEPRRKELHDKLLSEYGLSDEQFMWGSVRSIYDANSNVSSINIEYDYDEDEVPLFYNSDASFSKTIKNEDVKKLIDEDKPYILKDREKHAKETLREYLTYLIKRTDPNYYNIIKINYEAIDTLRKEYQAFLKILNYPDNRSEEVERFFLFLHEMV